MKMNEEGYKTAIGKLIKQTRGNLGVSQEAFAADLGLHRTYVGSIERGDQNLSLSNIVKLADHLGMDLSELFKAAEKLGPKPDPTPVISAGRKPKP